MFAVRLACLLIAALVTSPAWGGAPSYSIAGIVNTGNSSPGPFAPNSIVTIYGTDLSRSTQALTLADIRGGRLPTELNYTQVFVDNTPAPLLYVSPAQINLLIPADQSIVPAKIKVVTNIGYGPEVVVDIAGAAPALFLAGSYAIATHADNSLMSLDAPARAGEIIVLYLTGLGKTTLSLEAGEIPQNAAVIAQLSDLKVWLDGSALDPDRIKYAGVTPGSAGLYQINLALPDKIGEDPEIRVSIGAQTSPAGSKLAVR